MLRCGLTLCVVLGFAGTAAAQTPPDRGTYLVNSIVACGNCHTPQTPQGPAPGKEFSGGTRFQIEAGVAMAANITPDPETGIGRWTDAQLIRAIREGIGHDGRRLSLVMPYWKLSILTDDDVKSIVAYLRTLRPIRNRLPHWIPTRDSEPPPEPPRRPATNADLEIGRAHV